MGRNIAAAAYPSNSHATLQTGDTLGRALASVYATDHTSSSFGSSPATPICSPPPLTGPAAASVGQWQHPAASPHFKKTRPNPHQTHTDLDDAIHILRNHAESSQQVALPVPHSNPPPIPKNQLLSGPPLVDAALQGSDVADVPGAAELLPASGSFELGFSTAGVMASGIEPGFIGKQINILGDGNVKMEMPDGVAVGMSSADVVTFDYLSHSKSSVTAAAKRSRRQCTSSVDNNDIEDMNDDDNDVGGDGGEDEDDEDVSPEVKAQREKIRRQQNNARERVRVRDINDAFKELGRMISLHQQNEKPQTKLTILQQAVTLITNLEQQVRERNLNPKIACLKRREEEKFNETPRQMVVCPPQDVTQQQQQQMVPQQIALPNEMAWA
jgi:transcription factor 4/12